MRYASWERKGVKFIGDLLEDGKLMAWQRFKERYSISCIEFEYTSLLQSLPDAIKNSVCRSYQQPTFPARLQYVLSNKTFTRLFVKMKIANNQRLQSDINRIESKWIRDINSFDHLSVLNVKNGAFASRYLSFQFKLVMRILTTNTFLKLIRVQENDLCSFCHVNRETLAHLFISCDYVAAFWGHIARYLSRHGLGQLSEKTKIFGDSRNALITHVVTIAKHVIYSARRRNSRPCFNYFKNLLKQDFDTERHIARKNDKLEHFRNKWNVIWSDMNT